MILKVQMKMSYKISLTLSTHLFEFLDLSLRLQVTKLHKESHLRGKLSWF